MRCIRMQTFRSLRAATAVMFNNQPCPCGTRFITSAVPMRERSVCKWDLLCTYILPRVFTLRSSGNGFIIWHQKHCKHTYATVRNLARRDRPSKAAPNGATAKPQAKTLWANLTRRILTSDGHSGSLSFIQLAKENACARLVRCVNFVQSSVCLQPLHDHRADPGQLFQCRR